MEEQNTINQIHEIVSSVLILSGVFFMLLATIGLLRFPDFYTRMSTITKGSTLGLGLILIGLSVYFNEADVMLKVLLILFFIFITSPVAAHVISRTAVKLRIPFWGRTNLAEFQEYLEKDQQEGVVKKADESTKSH